MRIASENLNEWNGFNDNGLVSGKVEVVFKNVKERLVKEIGKSKCCFGCVAWLTDYDIIDALIKIEAQIVVQKEDFLRPDGSGWSKNELRDKYNRIKPPLYSYQEITLFRSSFRSMSECKGVRCAGNHNSQKKPAFPRMHNKFLIFGEVLKGEEHYFDAFNPLSVWTGSFNFSKNAGNSLENAVIIKDPKIANAYYQEYIQIMGISEQLDWASEWMQPEYRLGES